MDEDGYGEYYLYCPECGHEDTGELGMTCPECGAEMEGEEEGGDGEGDREEWGYHPEDDDLHEDDME